MSDLETYKKLKAKAATLRREADKAQGALDEVMRALKTNFSCKTLEQAEALVRKLARIERENAKAFKSQLKKFKTKWRRVLK